MMYLCNIFKSNVKQNIVMKHYVIFVFFLILLGCDTAVETKRLDEVDSLVVIEKYDSAYHEVLNYHPRYNDEKELAHYRLLLAQTSYLTYNTLSSDSVIDKAIAYYEQSGDLNRLADAYYYKASCLHERNENNNAIEYYKKAENVANKTKDLRLRYKIAESMVKINHQCGNYNLQLNYARKALGYALKSENNNWIAYSYFNLSNAFQNLETVDSLSYYTKKLIPRLGDIYPEDLPHFLSCIGFMYFKNGDFTQAKKYYEDALSHKEVAHTLVNLADIYIIEGNEEEAYKLWQKAFLLDDNGDAKDVIMFNMLQYDLEHHKNLEDACERMYRIYEIKDSLTNTLKNRTIQDLQQRYDEEALSHFYKNKIMTWMITALILIVLLLLVTGFFRYKRYRTNMEMAKQQMLIGQFNNEISLLTAQCQKAKNDISYYQSIIAEYTNQIEELKSSGKNADKQIMEKSWQIGELTKKNEELMNSYKKAKLQKEMLKQKITEFVENSSPILNRGKVLYDNIQNNKTIISWNKEDFRCFVEYYKAVHIKEYESIISHYEKLTYHNMLYLILCEMGLDNKAISQIMGISPESIRAIRHRLQKNLRAGMEYRDKE